MLDFIFEKILNGPTFSGVFFSSVHCFDIFLMADQFNELIYFVITEISSFFLCDDILKRIFYKIILRLRVLTK